MHIPKDLCELITEFADDSLLLKKLRVVAQIKSNADIIWVGTHRIYEMPGIDEFFHTMERIWEMMLWALRNPYRKPISEEMQLNHKKYCKEKK